MWSSQGRTKICEELLCLKEGAEEIMKVGDLVRLKEHCRNSDKLAIIVGLHRSAVKIRFFDSGKSISALISNLEILSESR